MENKSIATLQAEDFVTLYAPGFSKKDATQTGKDLANGILDKGEVDELKVWSNIVRLKEVISAVDTVFRERINIKTKDSANGVDFSFKNGSKKLNYSDDPIYKEIQTKLKDREKLLKTAFDSKDVIYDSEGIEVPKVSCEFNKSSITVEF